MSRYQGSRSYGGAGAGSAPRRDDPPARSIDDAWPRDLGGYLRGGYFDESGHLRPQYVERSSVGTLASEIAAQGLTPSQLRRFFGHARAMETRLKSGGRAWREVEADFHKLDVAAADAAGKKPKPKIPPIFHEFILRNVAAVKSEKDFLRGFLPHFEAVVGFCSGKLQDRN